MVLAAPAQLDSSLLCMLSAACMLQKTSLKQEAAPVTTEQTTGPPSFQFKVKEMLAENPLAAAPEPGKAKEKDAPVRLPAAQR